MTIWATSAVDFREAYQSTPLILIAKYALLALQKEVRVFLSASLPYISENRERLFDELFPIVGFISKNEVVLRRSDELAKAKQRYIDGLKRGNHYVD